MISRYSDDYARVANDTIACLIMIETAEALASLDEILSVPGIDGVYVGPVDLSLTLGLAPQPYNDDPAFLNAIDAVLAACERHGIVPGIHADEVLAPRWIERGFRLITVGYDQFAVINGLGVALEVSRGEPLNGPRQPFTGYR